jgi:predicted nucleic acid-binding Zn ribbon protein
MEPVSLVLYSLFRGTPRHGEWVVACLEGAWPGIVGDAISQVCKPWSCRGFSLVVHVENPAWEGTLKAMKEEILAKIRQATGGEVRELSFLVDPSA